MISTSGFFSNLPCPFLRSGLCERPHCHYAHWQRRPVSLPDPLPAPLLAPSTPSPAPVTLAQPLKSILKKAKAAFEPPLPAPDPSTSREPGPLPVIVDQCQATSATTSAGPKARKAIVSVKRTASPDGITAAAAGAGARVAAVGASLVPLKKQRVAHLPASSSSSATATSTSVSERRERAQGQQRPDCVCLHI